MNNTKQTALSFYRIALSLAPNPIDKKVNPEELKNFYVVWDGETVYEIATGLKISVHNWSQKKAKINYFYSKFLGLNIKNTQIYVVKDTNYSESLIIDGVHRSIGFYKAYLKDPTITSKVNFTYKFFESNKIREMYDYHRLFGKNT